MMVQLLEALELLEIDKYNACSCMTRFKIGSGGVAEGVGVVWAGGAGLSILEIELEKSWDGGTLVPLKVEFDGVAGITPLATSSRSASVFAKDLSFLNMFVEKIEVSSMITQYLFLDRLCCQHRQC